MVRRRSGSNCKAPFLRQLICALSGVSPFRPRAFTAATESSNAFDPYVYPPGCHMKSCCTLYAATRIDIRGGLY